MKTIILLLIGFTTGRILRDLGIDGMLYWVMVIIVAFISIAIINGFK